jgi:hypothetical protein
MMAPTSLDQIRLKRHRVVDGICPCADGLGQMKLRPITDGVRCPQFRDWRTPGQPVQMTRVTSTSSSGS